MFVSNYFNHHQAWISRDLDALTDHHFYFIETVEMEQERKALGWGNDVRPAYVLRAYDPAQKRRCRQLIARADAVIWGSCPYGMILPRLLRRRLTFSYSERLFKEGKSGFGFWGRAVKYGVFLRAPEESLSAVQQRLCRRGLRTAGPIPGPGAAVGLFPPGRPI